MVVGMVGGELKAKEFKDDGAKRNLYEIRRLSVDLGARGMGVGARLLQTLQEGLPVKSRIYADCTNIQPTAQRFYEKRGFELTKKFALHRWPFPFRMWRYQKEL